MQFLLKDETITTEQLTETAQQSAKYFSDCFQKDSLDTISIIKILTLLIEDRKELAVHIGLLHYCRLFNHDLPWRYMKIAENNAAYDYYCRELTNCLANL